MLDNQFDIREEYISLMKTVLTGLNRIDKIQFKPKSKLSENIYECEIINQSKQKRQEGLDWPVDAETMIGLSRIENVEFCVKEVLTNNIEGDFIETGVWRGGTCIFMRALLKAYGITNRKIWVADSFQGLPKPNEKLYPQDIGDILFSYNELKVSEEEVKENFRKYNLLDNQVVFIKGWFKDTMPIVPIKKLSVLRLDGDMYESTIDVLIYLYPKLTVGGFCIIDDWGAIPACKKAVEDYRMVFDLDEELHRIDWTGAFWKKNKDTESIPKEQFLKVLSEKEKSVQLVELEKARKLNLVASYSAKDLYSNEVGKKNIDRITVNRNSFSFHAVTKDPYLILPEISYKNDLSYKILIDISVDRITKVQVFYLTDKNEKYNEVDSVRYLACKGRQTLIISINNSNLKGRLRIDTGDFIGKYTIHNIEIRENPHLI
jgi:hypothetical protein